MRYEYQIPTYNLHSETELKHVHYTSIPILSRTEVRVPRNRKLSLASDYSAEVDRADQILWFPSDFIADGLDRAGKQLVLNGRERETRNEFGYGMYNFNGTTRQFRFCDTPGEVRRKPTTNDLLEAIQLGTQLKAINIVDDMVVPSEFVFSDLEVATEEILQVGNDK